jgi:hypothetical protein
MSMLLDICSTKRENQVYLTRHKTIGGVSSSLKSSASKVAKQIVASEHSTFIFYNVKEKGGKIELTMTKIDRYTLHGRF